MPPPNTRNPAPIRAAEGALTGATAGISLAQLLGASINPFAIGFGAAGLLFGIFGEPEREEPEEQRQRNLDKATIGPARWVYGTARISGDRKALEFNRGGDDISLYRWALLSQESIEGVASLWINGIRIALRNETLPRVYPNTDAAFMPGLIARRMGITGQFRAGSRRYVLGANRAPVPASDFYDDPDTPTLRTVSWVFQDNTLASLQGTPAAAFGDATTGGFAAGPNLRNPAAFSIILRRGDRIERFPFSSLDPVDPHVFLINGEQIEWLVGIGSDTTDEWDLALIRNDAFPTTDWSQAFAQPSSVEEPTGALVPDSPFLFSDDHKLSTPYLRVFPYLSADGTVPEQARIAAGLGAEGDTRWGDDHRLEGISWALLQLNAVPRPTPSTIAAQNEAGYWGTIPEDRLPPSIDFEVRGVRIRLPWQTTAEWTDNAAACVFHYMTTRMGVPRSDFDEEALREAVRICGEPRFVDLPGIYSPSGHDDPTISDRAEAARTGEPIFRGYSRSTIRFPVNGVVFGDREDPEKVLRELTAAMAGSVTYEDGAFVIRAGGQRRANWLITEDDLAGEPEKVLDHSNIGEVSGVKMSLLQSRDHEYQPVEMRPKFDHLVVGGEIVDLGERRFVNTALPSGRSPNSRAPPVAAGRYDGHHRVSGAERRTAGDPGKRHGSTGISRRQRDGGETGGGQGRNRRWLHRPAGAHPGNRLAARIHGPSAAGRQGGNRRVAVRPRNRRGRGSQSEPWAGASRLAAGRSVATHDRRSLEPNPARPMAGVGRSPAEDAPPVRRDAPSRGGRPRPAPECPALCPLERPADSTSYAENVLRDVRLHVPLRYSAGSEPDPAAVLLGEAGVPGG